VGCTYIKYLRCRCRILGDNVKAPRLFKLLAIYFFLSIPARLLGEIGLVIIALIIEKDLSLLILAKGQPFIGMIKFKDAFAWIYGYKQQRMVI
jgi:hypothetical protein